MEFMKDYLKLDVTDLLKELHQLIQKYNQIRETYLVIYASDIQKPIPDIAMSKDDYYTFFDNINDNASEAIDVYIETPGGKGDAAEEIARFLHKKFKKVSFVISGEAKSAGTILALSGHEILMTETGSLGPIDAQVPIGRSKISAYDYVTWVREKRHESIKNGYLNPFDAVMVAQISPGELCNVYHALEFAKDLVIEWLPKYKFIDWNVTEGRNLPVTPDMREARSIEIAEKLTNHATWRSHGRSIKIDDLENEIGLKISKIDEDKELSETVYRIHTLIRILFNKTDIYKVFVTSDAFIKKTATPKNRINQNIPNNGVNANTIIIEVQCPQCKEKHKFYALFEKNKMIEDDMKLKSINPIPKEKKYICKCGFEIDLSGIIADIEIKEGRKVILGD